MSTVADASYEILGRIVRPQSPLLSAQGAREILTLTFSDEDRQRMDELAAKAQAGSLSAAEQDECRTYEQIGHLLSLLHSKARSALKQAEE